MKFPELLSMRQSVRAYQDRPVEPEKLRAIINAVRLAPAACKSRPWTVIITEDPVVRERVARATFSSTLPFNRFALEAPVIAIVTVERPAVINRVTGWIRRRELSLITAGIAAEHFCLQASELASVPWTLTPCRSLPFSDPWCTLTASAVPYHSH